MSYQQRCEREDCDGEVVVVVKEDALNGTRLCEECLYKEGMMRGWWL